MRLRGIAIVVLLCILFIPSCRQQALDAVGQAIGGLVSGMVGSVTDGIKGVADDVSDKARSATDGIMDSVTDPFRDLPNVEPGAGDENELAAPPVFRSMDEAALAALAEARRYSQCSDEFDGGPFEFGGLIYKRSDGLFSFNGPMPGIGNKFEVGIASADFKSRSKPGDEMVASYHSHPGFFLTGGDHFSLTDLCGSAILQHPSYVVKAGSQGDRITRKFLPNGNYLDARLSPPSPDAGAWKGAWHEWLSFTIGSGWAGSGAGTVVSLTKVPDDPAGQCPAPNKLDRKQDITTTRARIQAKESSMYSRCIYDPARIGCLVSFVNAEAVPASDCNKLKAGVGWESCVVGAIKNKFSTKAEEHIQACGAVPW